MERVDCVVVGAGVVGLAVARALALTGREVLVLESQTAIGTGTSSRNSEVIHAGLYYPRGSLKARLCVQGRALLYAYCAARGVAHRQCGKLLVATSQEQHAQLDAVMAAGLGNGVTDLRRLSQAEARAMEPDLACVGAVLSPSTGIIDSHAYMLALQGDLEHAGGMVVLQATVQGAQCGPDGIRLRTADGTQLLATLLVNSAGLAAPALARRIEGLPQHDLPTAYFAKGNYFSLAARCPFSRLIYPVPEKAGLGVHLTIDMAGQAKFGPDVQWVSGADDLVVDPARGAAFYAQIRRYWPGLAQGALQPAYAGIRPKLQAPGEEARDFLIQGPADHGVPGVVNLFGIESPGLTSSLAIGQHVAALCS
jgi:L-2-hydroxyglutarate oxidase LhgO